MLIRHMEKKNGKQAYHVMFEADYRYGRSNSDDGMSPTVDEKDMTINSSSKSYRRTIHNKDENILKNRFLEGQCPVAKKGYGQVSVIYFPKDDIEGIDGFEKIGNQGERSWFYHKANDKINIGGESIELHSIINAVDLFNKASSHDIVCVASVCKDKDGFAEGFTFYFIELLNITPPDELPKDGSATQGEQSAQQPQDTSNADAAAQQQAEEPKEQASNNGESGEGDKKENKPNEQFIRRDRNGNMIPYRIINVRNEADGSVDTTGNGSGNSDSGGEQKTDNDNTQTDAQQQDNTEQKEDAEAVNFPEVFKSFIAGNFAKGFQDLIDKTHYPQLVGAASAVRFDKFPWLGRCTFAAGTNTTVDGSPCLNLSVLPWNHESQSSMEEAWSVSRKTASASEIGDDLAKDMTKNAEQGNQQKTQTQSSQQQQQQPQGQQGTTGNQLLDAAAANGQNVTAQTTQGTQQTTQQPANQIQAQQSMGHSPTTEDPAQARQALQAVQKTDGQSYLKNLVKVISSKFGNSAGKDELAHYEIFAKWRDAMFETDPKKSREMGFAPISSKGELMTKYANLRTSKKSSQWILF